MLSATAIGYRQPCAEDGAGVWRLASADRQLDDNSPYCYLLLCSHFSGTSIVAEADGEIVGFTAAYRPPEQPDTLFIWQVAVAPSAARQGIASRMVSELLARLKPAYMEATVTPSNTVSGEFFNSLARRYGARLVTSEHFPQAVFPDNSHEAEILYRIGPLGG